MSIEIKEISANWGCKIEAAIVSGSIFNDIILGLSFTAIKMNEKI